MSWKQRSSGCPTGRSLVPPNSFPFTHSPLWNRTHRTLIFRSGFALRTHTLYTYTLKLLVMTKMRPGKLSTEHGPDNILSLFLSLRFLGWDWKLGGFELSRWEIYSWARTLHSLSLSPPSLLFNKLAACGLPWFQQRLLNKNTFGHKHKWKLKHAHESLLFFV